MDLAFDLLILVLAVYVCQGIWRGTIDPDRVNWKYWL